MAVSQRVVAGTAAQLRWQAVNQDGEPSDPGLTTVQATRSDGSTVLAAGSPTVIDGTARTVEIAPQECDLLTVTWTGALAVETVEVEIVGGVYFTVAELRAHHTAVTDDVEYPAEMVRQMRQVVEVIFEHPHIGVFFVPRFMTIAPSNGMVRQRGVRTVHWVRLDDGSFVTSGLDDYVEISADGVQCLSSAIDLVGLVAGYPAPPADVWRVAMLATRHLLTAHRTEMDFRVMSVTNPDGSRSQYATPGLSQWVTGIPEVDEVLKRYGAQARQRVGSIHTVPWVHK